MLYDVADRLATRQQRFAVVLEPDAPPRRAIELSGVEPAAWLHADQAVRARRARRLGQRGPQRGGAVAQHGLAVRDQDELDVELEQRRERRAQRRVRPEARSGRCSRSHDSGHRRSPPAPSPSSRSPGTSARGASR